MTISHHQSCQWHTGRSLFLSLDLRIYISSWLLDVVYYVLRRSLL